MTLRDLNMNKTSVLIIGASGFIGKYLYNRLQITRI